MLLSKKNKRGQKLNATYLKGRGFELDHWGSPYDRLMYDTRMYVMSDDTLHTFMYFPKTFQGIALPDGGGPADVRGCLWVEYKDYPCKIFKVSTVAAFEMIMDMINSREDDFSDDWWFEIKSHEIPTLSTHYISNRKPSRVFTNTCHGNLDEFMDYLTKKKRARWVF